MINAQTQPLLLHHRQPRTAPSNWHIFLHCSPLEPIHLGGISACLESSLTPSTFTPDLNDSNPDGTIQAYLYSSRLPPLQQPLPSLMFQHFNRFLLSELQLLNQEVTNLLKWHNCILGSMDHARHCTLERVSRQFQSSAPDLTIMVETLTDRKRFHFDFPLTWAYSVWIAQHEYYHKR